MTSTEMMEDLLKFEADWKTIQIVYNSLAGRRDFDEKAKKARGGLMPNFGYLYEYKESIQKTKTFDEFKEVFKVEYYKDIVKDVPEPTARDITANTKTIDDIQ